MARGKAMTSLCIADKAAFMEMWRTLDGIIASCDERIAEYQDAMDREKDTPRQDAPRPTGAYRLWLKELAAKKRTRTTFDTLWRAAVRECNGLDYRRAGLWKAAAEEFAIADQILEGKR